MVGRTVPALVLAVGCVAVLLPPTSARPADGGLDSDLSQDAACQVGGSPTYPYGEEPPEEFLRYETRPVVIGCATLGSGRRFELVGYQLARGSASRLCIDHYDFDSGSSWGCGSNLIHGGGAIDATSTTSLRVSRRPRVVSGTIAGSVRRLVVRSEIGGRLHRHPAARILVRDRELLEAIAVRRPFGRYIAEVPRGARAATAEALSARGHTLGLAFFPGFRGPLGEALACYGRPRIARARLLDRPRPAAPGRVRILVSYPRGLIRSVDVAVAGAGTFHADLAPPRTRGEAGSRLVTVPVRFGRRRTVAVDITAKGRPLARRCGKRPPPRRSATKTLVVRVR